MGPNYVWHIDGHDKQKPFDFSIHECIDGYLRKLLWFEVGTSNKIPEVIAKYYLDAVKNFGVPLNIIADNGTEHALIEPIHTYLRYVDIRDGAINSFFITTSPQNQWIEAYWSILQRDRIGWLKSFLIDLADLELFFADDPVQLDCIRFCFINLIRKDLYSIQSDWNTHIISRSRCGRVTGRPDTLYFLPHIKNKENYSLQVDVEEIEEFHHVTSQLRDVSEEFKEFSTLAIEDQQHPETVTEALSLYVFLFMKIRDLS